SGQLVYQHRLWSVDRSKRRRDVAALSKVDEVEKRPVQVLDDVVRKRTASIEPLVDHRAVFLGLGEEIAVEAGVAAASGVEHINVGKLASAQLVDLATIPFNPIEVAQRYFVVHRDHRHFSRTRSVRIWPDLDYDLFTGSRFKERIDVVGPSNIPAAHSK